MARNLRFGVVVALAAAAVLVDSASYLLSLFEDGILMAMLLWVVHGMDRG